MTEKDKVLEALEKDKTLEEWEKMKALEDWEKDLKMRRRYRAASVILFIISCITGSLSAYGFYIRFFA